MRHVFCRKIVFLLAALLVVCGMSARKPIKTLLITGQNNHNWQVSHVVLKQILENSGRFSVDFAGRSRDVLLAARVRKVRAPEGGMPANGRAE